MANLGTHYDNLKVARDAPPSVIKAAYKALCQSYHPDKFQGSNVEAERIMKIVNASYVVLIDPILRAEHDVWIKNKEAEVTKQQNYQRQDKDTPKKEEPPPSTKANQQSHSTATEAEIKQRWEQWSNNEQKRNQKQGTQQNYTSPTNSYKQSWNPDGRETYTLKRTIKEFFIIGGLLGAVIFFFNVLEVFINKEKTAISRQLQAQPVQAQQAPSLSTNSAEYESLQNAKDLYSDGKYDEAAVIYQQLALKGYRVAQYMLGTMYELGQGVMKDNDEAVYWLSEAAKQGDKDAQKRLNRRGFIMPRH